MEEQQSSRAVHRMNGYNCQILCAQFLFADNLFMNDKHQVKGDLFLIPKLNKDGAKT